MTEKTKKDKKENKVATKDNGNENSQAPVISNLPATTTSLQKYISEISNYPILSRKEEQELARRYKEEGDIEAARKLVVSNLRFVVKIANEYRNYGVNVMDLIQEGNIGLMHAVKGFDPTKGYRLISYAVWWIRAYIQNYLMKSWSLVKVGTSQAQRKLFYKLRSAKKDLEIVGESPTGEEYKEIAEELDVSARDVMEMDQRMSKKDFSLDTELSEDRESTHLDFLEDRSMSQEEELEKTQETELIRENLEDVLNSLNERERYIIENRILTESPETLEDIGNRYGISRERVRQIEAAALKKVRKFLTEKGIDYL